MSNNTCIMEVGRLAEITLDPGYESAADVEHMIQDIWACARRLPAGGKLLILADWRRCRVMAPAAADRVLALLTAVNPVVERAAILASPTYPTGVLQFMRLVREGGSQARRVCTDPQDAYQWLAPLLNPLEAARLKLRLAQTSQSSSATGTG